MSKSKVTIQVMNPGQLKDDVLMLGDAYVKQWKIPVRELLTVKLGSEKQLITLQSVPRYDGLRIPAVLARKFGLQNGQSLRLRYHAANQTLIMGPFIGILVSKDRPDNPEKPFGPISMFCKELVEACQAQGAMACVFTPEHLEQTYEPLTAWVYHNRTWKKAQVPIPDVINNRLTTRKSENKPRVQQFMQEVKSKHGGAVFNEKFLDKTEVFDVLKKDSSIGRYLPESHALRNYATLKSMCAKYSVVFLKPARGSLGKGIIRITKLNEHSYQAMYTTVNGTRRQSFSSLPKMFSTISGKLSNNRYQIQQGLSLMENGGRPVDFRALVQKNATGKWTLTSIVARTASNQHFVSNLARGGTLSTVKDAMIRSNIPSGAKQDMYSKLKLASLQIAQGIDTHIPAHFGELGIDLAVDHAGRVWLLEVNSKPSKNDNTPLHDNKVRPSVRKIIEYAKYLTGF